MITLGTIGLLAFAIIVAPFFGYQDQKVVIAGKLGSEPEILINMYKILIEDETDRKLN